MLFRRRIALRWSHRRESNVKLPVDPSELLIAQRGLRDRLLSGTARAQRELAAEMLLYLDEPQRCWQACADWLLTETGAERIDAGFANATDACYRPVFESLRGDIALPRVLGTAMNARDPGIVAVWASPIVLVFDDVGADARLGPVMRATLLAAGTRRKLAVALRNDGRDVGLLCVDAVSAAHGWQTDECARLDQAAREVIAPILAAVRRFAGDRFDDAALAPATRDADPATRFDVARFDAACAETARSGDARSLTPAEWRVARLVLAGCSYKEIARRLDRSASTIDHQLRSMREKLGVNSTAKLMRGLMTLAPAMSPSGDAASDLGRH